MRKIHEKTPAELENQLIDYLLHSDSVPTNMPLYDMGKLASHLLSIKDLDTASSSPRLRAYNPVDIDGFVKGFAPHLRSRSRDPEFRGHQAEKVRMIARYNDEFASLVANIDFNDESELLAGSWATPRLLEKDGIEYIVRKITPRVDVQQVEKHIDAGLRVTDIPHMEHIVAISYKDGVTVAPKLPGISFKQLEFSGAAKDVNEGQLREFVTCMKLADERGVEFDGGGGNIFYDSVEGFSALDLAPRTTDSDASWQYALTEQMDDLAQGASSDLDFIYEVDRICRIVEKIFTEEQTDEASFILLQKVRKEIAGTIERLEMFAEFDKQDARHEYSSTFFDGDEDAVSLDD